MTNTTTTGQSEMGAALKKEPMDKYLERRGIKPNKDFGDYSDYIEAAQKTKKTKLVHPDLVPIRGSIHISTGRTRDPNKSPRGLFGFFSCFKEHP